MENPYSTVDRIPLHIFSNKECTKSPSKPLRNYLRWMYDNHKYDLEYLWRHTQLYSNYGGCYILPFEKWLTKLERDLIKQEKSP